MTGSTEDVRLAVAGRLPRDFMIGAAILVFCAAAYWITLGFQEAPAALAQNVQPASFPRLVIGVIACLSVVMMVLGLGQSGQRQKVPPISVFVTATMMIGFVVAFDTLGIIAAMALFTLTMPILWGERRIFVLIAFAVLFPALVYTVFALGLGVYFAPGVLAQLAAWFG